MAKIIGPASLPQQLFLTLRDGTGKRSKYATEEGEEVDIIFYGGQAGGGKALLHGEKVLTPNGFVNIEDSYEGMQVVAPDNSVQVVTNVYPQGEVDIYEVLFQDGRKIKCCGNHLWKFHKSGQDGKKVVQDTISIKKYVDHQKQRKGRKSLPIVELPVPLDFSNKTVNLKIKPYTMGVLLGDGCLRGDCISFTTTDPEMVASVNMDGYSTAHWHSGAGLAHRVDGVKSNLIEYGLYMKSSIDKFIPEDYLESSVEDRFALIQGLMDTDGYVTRDGKTYFYTISEKLSSDVKKVLYSLGFTVTVSRKKAGYKKDGEYIQCNDVYCLYIRGRNQRELFRLNRKKSRTVSKEVGIRIDSVDYVGRGMATCISVTGDHLFVTTDYIVTHNSFASLLHHMKYNGIERYKGVTIRRTTPMLTKPGAIWDEAKDLYKEFDPTARIRNKDMKISFGPVKDIDRRAEVSFTHFERVDDTDNFQGSQLSSAVMDELCQFEESQFLYILSRLRTKADMKPTMRATMNPDPDAWVKKWIQYYLYPEGHPEFGRPDPSKQGKVRWFIRNGNDMIWTETREEMFEKHGRRDEDGNLLPESDRKQIKPLSFAFISASVYDNPYIDDNYIAFLEGLERVEKEILLYGSWEARKTSLGMIRREWFIEKDEEPHPSEIDKTVRAYDFAYTKKSELSPSPDYTVSVKMSRLKSGDYFIHDIRQARVLPGEWLGFILDAAREDGVKTDIILPLDPGPGAKFTNQVLTKEISSAGYFVRQIRSQGGKIDRFKPFASMVMNGGMQILKNCATDYENGILNDNTFYYNQLEAFDGRMGVRKRGENGHDDLCDASADAFEAAATHIKIPDISHGLKDLNLTTTNPFLD